MSNFELFEDALFIDAVTEILNIGMGAAAASLSEMIDKEVLLTAPTAQFVTKAIAIHIISNDQSSSLSGVIENFGGAFKGKAILFFPEQQSLELVRAFLGDGEEALHNLTEMEQEAITEIGNVILNACLSSIADLLHKYIESTVPEFINGSIEKILDFESMADSAEHIVLLLKMEFSIEVLAIQGYVTFLLDTDLLGDLKSGVETFLAA